MLRKAMIVVLSTFILSTLIILFGITEIIENSIEQYQKEETVDKQEAVNVFFDEQFRNLEILNQAHAYWTIASNSVTNQDDDWISDNLTIYLIEGDFNIDFVYLSNETETYYKSEGVLRENIVTSNIYNTVLNEDAYSSSILTFNNRIYMVVGLPFANDDQTNKNGVLLLGREFNQEYEQQLKVILGDLHEDHFITSTSIPELTDFEYKDAERFSYSTPDSTLNILAHFEYSFVYYLTETAQLHMIGIILATILLIVMVVFYTLNLYRKKVDFVVHKISEIDFEATSFNPIEYTNVSELDQIINVLNLLGKRVESHIDLLIQKNTEIIHLLITASEINDLYTKQHGDRVARISKRIGLVLKVSNIDDLERAARLHDIGKVFLNNEILNKPSALSNEEYNLVKQHPIHGAKLVATIKQFSDLKLGILHHHERFDGTGYPSKLKGYEIPLFARIIAIADVYEAITSDRPYRKAFSKDDARNIMLNGSNTLFDPDILEVFLNLLDNSHIE